MVAYKQKCRRCNKNYVLVTRRSRHAVCYECDKVAMKGEVTDPVMKELFDLPEEFYEENAFLRDIKISYLRYGKLTDRQIEAFKQAAEKMRG